MWRVNSSAGVTNVTRDGKVCGLEGFYAGMDAVKTLRMVKYDVANTTGTSIAE
jgi:hypothetical protein